MSKINITTAVNIEVENASGFEDLFDYAEDIANVEGKNLYKHLLKMSTSAGDLAATAIDDFQPTEHTHEEVAGLMLRAAIFANAIGMTAEDLKSALARETMRLLRDGLGDRVAKVMDKAGFECGGVAISL